MPKFLVTDGLVEYNQAIQTMNQIIAEILEGKDEVVWFLEHPPIYTAGANAKASDLILPIFPVHQVNRGGQYTYHGPGQLVVYVMLNLKKRHNDVRAFVKTLETWVIQTLATLGLFGKCKQGMVGVWLDDEKGARKIAAIGVRVTRGVTWHGLAINVNPDLNHYRGIIPCGLKEHTVTSLHAEKVMVTLPAVITIMQAKAKDCGLFELGS